MWLAILAFREEPQCPRVWKDKEGPDPQAPWDGGTRDWGKRSRFVVEVGGHGWAVITVALILFLCPQAQAHGWP